MKIPPLLLILLVGLVPIGVFTSLVIVPANVKWQPPVIWTTGFQAGPGPISGRVTPMASSSDGSYVAGQAIVLKLSLRGTHLWTQQVGNASDVQIDFLNIHNDSLYVGAENITMGGSIFLEKFDSNGNMIWKVFASKGQFKWGMSASASGLYVAGVPETSGSTAVDPLTVRRFDLDGNLLWSKIIGYETQQVTFQSRDRTVLVYADSTGAYLGGSDDFINYTTSTHAFVSRINTSGNISWTRVLDSTSSLCPCLPYALTADSSGIYVGGWTAAPLQGEAQFNSDGSFVRKYDPNGVVLWTNGRPRAVTFNLSVSASNVYSFEGPFARYDSSNGNLVWSFNAEGVLGAAAEDGFYAVNPIGQVVKYDQSASLVFFGINPPYSFLITGVIVGIIPVGLLLKKRQITKQSGSRVQ